MSRSSTPDTQIYRPSSPEESPPSRPIERPLQFLPRRVFKRFPSSESYSTTGSFTFDELAGRTPSKDSDDIHTTQSSRLQPILRQNVVRRSSGDSYSLDESINLEPEQPKQQSLSLAHSSQGPRRRSSAESFQTTGSFALDEATARNWEARHGWQNNNQRSPPQPKPPQPPPPVLRNFSRPLRPIQTPRPAETRPNEPVRIAETPLPPTPLPSPPPPPTADPPTNSSGETTFRSSFASDSDSDSSSGSSASSVLLGPEDYLGHVYKSKTSTAQAPFVPPASGPERVRSPKEPERKTVRFQDSVTARPDLLPPRPEPTTKQPEPEVSRPEPGNPDPRSVRQGPGPAQLESIAEQPEPMTLQAAPPPARPLHLEPPPQQLPPPALVTRSSYPPLAFQRPPQPSRKQVSFEHSRAPPPSLLEETVREESIQEEPTMEGAEEPARPSTSSTTTSNLSVSASGSTKAVSTRSTRSARSVNTIGSVEAPSVDSEASLSTQAIAEAFKASDFDISSLTPKQLAKLKKKGVDPALYLEMKAATAKAKAKPGREEPGKGKEKEGSAKKGGRFRLGGRALVGNAFIG